jgi:GntR family transcriptional regulator
MQRSGGQVDVMSAQRGQLAPPETADERIVRGTELAEPEDTTRENILAEAGYEQVYDIDEIITRMPTPEEVARLGIASGTPVAEHIRTGYTAEDRAVRVMMSIVPGDVLILQYTVPM